MEMEGRGFSEFFRNSSEEMFLKSWMENSIGMPTPTMEMLGFKNLSQNFRADSEELFKSWLTNGENPAHNSSSLGHRTRQASRRFSTEIANFSSQQHLGQKKSNDVIIHPPKSSPSDAISGSLNQTPARTVVDNGMGSSDLYLAKAWFHSTKPMTRSRSSELRKRYAAMQSGQMPLGMETMFVSGHVANTSRQEFENAKCFTNLSSREIADKSATFMSPSNSSSSNFNGSQMVDVDKVSSVVSMLKGTLERKKLSGQIEKESVVGSSIGHFYTREVTDNPNFSQTQGSHHIQQMSRIFQVSQVEGPTDIDFEGFISSANHIQSSRVSQEPSQSESSAAAAVVSSGFDACDGPSISNQTLGVCENSKKHVGEGWSPENGSRPKELRERIIDNLKDDRKRGNLARYGSVTSAGTGNPNSGSAQFSLQAYDDLRVLNADKGDPTKKRRVERTRKMAEAKERNLTPAIPSDMQSVLKRCEALEKEVRSLKLNLSFMNRKDSEQTKQIEELQKQNKGLTDEKERLLEEIERILSETV